MVVSSRREMFGMRQDPPALAGRRRVPRLPPEGVMEFIELGSARKDDVLVGTAGLVLTVRSVDDQGIECASGAGDATGETQAFRWGWGDRISPTDQVLLLYRPPDQS